MRPDYTEIAVVLDASGSMQSCVQATLGGFNKFIIDQCKEAGSAKLSLTQFNYKPTAKYTNIDIQDVPKLSRRNYKPSGGTALYDAIGVTIDALGESLSSMPESARPGKVIVVIITDGQENASVRYTGERIRLMIDHQKERYSWEFLFIGANQDAITEAAAIGIPMQSALTYAANDIGTQSAYSSFSRAVSVSRGGTGLAIFSLQDREEQKKAGG